MFLTNALNNVQTKACPFRRIAFVPAMSKADDLLRRQPSSIVPHFDPHLSPEPACSDKNPVSGAMRHSVVDQIAQRPHQSNRIASYLKVGLTDCKQNACVVSRIRIELRDALKQNADCKSFMAWDFLSGIALLGFWVATGLIARNILKIGYKERSSDRPTISLGFDRLLAGQARQMLDVQTA